jgi:hypothetical protein
MFFLGFVVKLCTAKMFKEYVFPLIEKNEMGDVFWVCYNIELNQKCLKELKNAADVV